MFSPDFMSIAERSFIKKTAYQRYCEQLRLTLSPISKWTVIFYGKLKQLSINIYPDRQIYQKF